jgi:O-methyltransferase
MFFSEDKYQEMYSRVAHCTMTSFERVRVLIESMEYIGANNLPGSIVECGVWKGGSMMAAALALLELGVNNRLLYLYDTFAGMPKPGCHDVSFQGDSAEQIFQEHNESGKGWCLATLEEARENLHGTGYPETNVRFVPGRVEETLLKTVPERIAVLRLDTDWYESTMLELEVLFPRLCVGGILILDDYGHWEGARKAVDEYFSKEGFKPFMARIDYTGRLVIKLPPKLG